MRVNVEDRKQAVFDLNGIAPFNEEMTFYYDESGNCRKFSLTEEGFNSIDALKEDIKEYKDSADKANKRHTIMISIAILLSLLSCCMPLLPALFSCFLLSNLFAYVYSLLLMKFGIKKNQR